MNETEILNETHRADGSLATQIIKDGRQTYLVQYDRNNTVSFTQPLNGNLFSEDKITYKDGQVATIMTNDHTSQTRILTQYDENGNITVSQNLGKNDIVNYENGYIKSIIKYSTGSTLDAKERDELQYGPNGVLLSSTHQTQVSVGSVLNKPNMWTTTQQTTYYPNGKINTVISFTQRHNRIPSNTGQTPGDNAEYDAYTISMRDILNYGQYEADSYISSILQYSEDGKITASIRLNELDEVNYYPNGRICSILRKNENGEPTSLTSYDQQGNIANETVYSNGRILSSTDFVDGKPVSNTQQGNEQYQNIFTQTKSSKSQHVIITNETRNKQGRVVTRTFKTDKNKYIVQYDTQGNVILKINLSDKDKITYDEEGRISSHTKTNGHLYVEYIEYDKDGKQKRKLSLKDINNVNDLSKHQKIKSFGKGIAKLSQTKFSTALNDLFIGYLIVNTGVMLKNSLHNPSSRIGEVLTTCSFPGPINNAYKNLLGNVKTWEKECTNNEEINTIKNYITHTDWNTIATQNKRNWHPAEDHGISIGLPNLDMETLDRYVNKGWDHIEKAYTFINRSLTNQQKNIISKGTSQERV